MDLNVFEQKFGPYPRANAKLGRTAFTVMSCQPLHVGHVRVINRMILDYKTVLIGLPNARSRPSSSTPFTDSQRIKMLHNVYGNRVRTVLIDKQPGDLVDDWPQHCVKTVLREGWPEPTDYYTGSQADASQYEGYFWGKMVSAPELEAEENRKKYYIDGTDGSVLRRLCLLRQDFQQIPSSSEIRKLLQSRNYAWRTWIPAVNHDLVESIFPTKLK
jgi:nicotinamide mononucleotide adenylyltransferase